MAVMTGKEFVANCNAEKIGNIAARVATRDRYMLVSFAPRDSKQYFTRQLFKNDRNKAMEMFLKTEGKRQLYDGSIRGAIAVA